MCVCVRETDRQADIQRDRQRERQREAERERKRLREREGNRWTDRRKWLESVKGIERWISEKVNFEPTAGRTKMTNREKI